MVAVMLLMLTGGIAFSQAVSDPRAVTLSWLRLGGITSVALLSIVGAAFARFDTDQVAVYVWIATLVCAIAQLLATQLARRTAQRWLAAAAFAGATVCVVWLAANLFVDDAITTDGPFTLPDVPRRAGLISTAPVAAALVGGYLMTMLLGHAYLTAGGEMTQAPFRRLVVWLGGMLAARIVLSAIFGVGVLLWSDDAVGELGIWKGSILAARYAVGFIVPAIFTWMIHDCVRRRSNQSATGILYVATLLVIIGEWAAVSLWESTGLVF